MYQHPVKKVYERSVAAVAQGADVESPALVAPFDFMLDSVEYIAPTVITGADTDTRKVSLINKGQAGSGATEMAALQFNSGVNAAAFDSKPITKSGTAANLNGLQGDVLSWKSLHVGNGIADPGGLVRVTLSKREV